MNNELPLTSKCVTEKPASREHASSKIRSYGCLPGAIGLKTPSGNIPLYRAKISLPVLTMEVLWPRSRSRSNCSPVAHPSHTTTFRSTYAHTPHPAAPPARFRATGAAQAVTVPYGTEAECYQEYADALVLGPGNIAQAHTVGEWIAVDQLREAVEVYSRLIEDLCA